MLWHWQRKKWISLHKWVSFRLLQLRPIRFMSLSSSLSFTKSHYNFNSTTTKLHLFLAHQLKSFSKYFSFNCQFSLWSKYIAEQQRVFDQIAANVKRRLKMRIEFKAKISINKHKSNGHNFACRLKQVLLVRINECLLSTQEKSTNTQIKHVTSFDSWRRLSDSWQFARMYAVVFAFSNREKRTVFFLSFSFRCRHSVVVRRR